MVAERTLDPWNAGKTQGGRRSKERGWDGVRKNGDGTVTERRRDGHGNGIKTLASL